MAESLKSLIKASKNPLKNVGKGEANVEFERIKELQSVESAANRTGKSPEEIRDEAKKAGVNVIDWIKDKYPAPPPEKKPAERKVTKDIVSSPVNRIETPEEKEARISTISKAVEEKTYTPAAPETVVDKILSSLENKEGSSIATFDMKSGKRDRSKEATERAKKTKAAERQLETGNVSIDPSKTNITRVQYQGGKELPLDQQFRDAAGNVVSLDDPRVQTLTKKLGITTGVSAPAATPVPTPVATPVATPEVKKPAPTPAPKKVEEPVAPVAEKEPVTVKDKVKKGNQFQVRKAITPAKQFAIITAESPRFASSEGGNDALKKELEAKGYKVEQIQGKYGALENPFLVEAPNPEDIKALGKKYGQESVILADKNSYKMEYTSGPKEGQYHSADKINVFSSAPDDYYSTVVRNGKPIYFNIDFNMDKLEGRPSATAGGKSLAQITKKPAGGRAGTLAEEAVSATKIAPTPEQPSALKTLQEGFKAQSTTEQLVNDTTQVLKQAGASVESAADEAVALVKRAEKTAQSSGQSTEGVLKSALNTGLDVLKKNPKTAIFGAAVTALGGIAALGGGGGGKKEPPVPTPPPGPGPKPGPAVTPDNKKRGDKTLAEGQSTLTEFEKYKKSISLTDKEEEKFAGIEARLKESLDSARQAYSEGMRSTELYKALEKIAEGLVLYGAGLYGKKTGIDAVSGLKFSPIDWSTRTDRLTKELDMAEKSYTKGLETVKEEKRGIEKLRKEAMDFEEARKEREERRAERLATKQEAAAKETTRGQKDILEGRIKDLDRQINDIEKARTSTPKTDGGMERQYRALAPTIGVPESEFMTGMFGGFREKDADAAFLKKQQELIQRRSQLEKQLRGEATPAATTGLTAEQEARRQELLKKQQAGK